MGNFAIYPKVAVLEEFENNECPEVKLRNEREIVDKFVNYQRKPVLEDTTGWNDGMFQYFHEKWVVKWGEVSTGGCI